MRAIGIYLAIVGDHEAVLGSGAFGLAWRNQ